MTQQLTALPNALYSYEQSRMHDCKEDDAVIQSAHWSKGGQEKLRAVDVNSACPGYTFFLFYLSLLVVSSLDKPWSRVCFLLFPPV